MKHLQFITLLLLLGLFDSTTAQSDSIILGVTAPAWMNWVLDDDDLIQEFEDLHPGVTFEFVPADEEFMTFSPPAMDTEDTYFDFLQTYVEAGDVVYVDQRLLGPEATTAGYFLNLLPLAETDPDLNINDYYQGAWNAYQWDRGLWALPSNADVQLLIYNQHAFDLAGLSYPNDNWTLDDFGNAARKLTKYDADGNLTLPAMLTDQVTIWLRALAGQGFYDSTSFPAPPNLNTPELVALVEQWKQMRDEQLVDQSPSDGNYEQIPIRFTNPWMLTTDSQLPSDAEGEIELVGALLPNGTASVYSDGFAVSVGTQYPEHAYHLAKFLADKLGWGEPARRSQQDNPDLFMPSFSPEVQALVDTARDNSLGAGELRYSSYLNLALTKMQEGNLDAQAALNEVQALAMNKFEQAVDLAGTIQIEVISPEPPPELAPGEIALELGVDSYGPFLPNNDQWEQVLDDFAASKSEIGYVELETEIYTSDGINVDCYIIQDNLLEDPEFDHSILYNIDPFLDADPLFDPNDLVVDVLPQVQYQGLTYAYPLFIQPAFLFYDSSAFHDAGIPTPSPSWSAEDFALTMEQLSLALDEDQNTLVIGGDPFNLSLLMLVASFGGLPYDTRTTPPTLNLDDPQNVAAIQRVLDLARNKYLTYMPSTDLSDGDQFGKGLGSSVFYIEPIGSGFPISEEDPYQMIPFPSGSRYTPITYNVGMAYINSETLNPEACYDLISTVSANPSLLSGMPVRRSYLTERAFVASTNPDILAFYEATADTLAKPSTITFFQNIQSISAWLELHWMNKAFDDYATSKEPTNLEAALSDTQDKMLSFRACTSEISPSGPESNSKLEDDQAYYRQFVDCAIGVDPDYPDPFSQWD